MMNLISDITDDEFDSEVTPVVRLSDLTPLLAYIPPTSESELLAPVSVPNLEKCDDHQSESELLAAPTCEPSTSTQPAIWNEPCVGNRKGTKRKLPATEQPTNGYKVTASTESTGTVKFRNVIWKKNKMERQKEDIQFSGISTLPREILNLQTPLQFFNFFVTEELLEHICNETHKYSIQLDVNKPFHLTKTELKKFLGICVMMSLIHIPNCRNYWNEVLGNRTIIETMPVNRFESIKKYLHFNDNDTAVPFNDFRHDRLHKLRPFLDSINERFALVPLPTESRNINE